MAAAAPTYVLHIHSGAPCIFRKKMEQTSPAMVMTYGMKRSRRLLRPTSRTRPMARSTPMSIMGRMVLKPAMTITTVILFASGMARMADSHSIRMTLMTGMNMGTIIHESILAPMAMGPFRGSGMSF